MSAIAQKYIRLPQCGLVQGRRAADTRGQWRIRRPGCHGRWEFRHHRSAGFDSCQHRLRNTHALGHVGLGEAGMLACAQQGGQRRELVFQRVMSLTKAGSVPRSFSASARGFSATGR